MQGNIWAGTFYGGVNYFNPSLDYFTHYAAGDGINNLSFSFIGDMAEDKRGDLWICTEGGGLNHLDRKSHIITRYLTGKDGNGKFANLKGVVYDKKRDYLYISVHKQGLIIFDISAKKVIYQQKGDHIKYYENLLIYKDCLYALVDAELKAMVLQTQTVRSLYPAVKEAQGISCFTIDSEGHLWMSRQNQIVGVDLRDTTRQHRKYEPGAIIPKDFEISHMIAHPNGNIYLGTYGAGIYELNTQTGKIAPCMNTEFKYCYAMQSSADGKLIISHEKGITIYQTDTKTAKLLDADMQLHLTAMNEDCGLYLCSNGELFAGGVEGLTSFSINSFQNFSLPYQSYFATLFVNNSQILYDSTQKMMDTVFPFAKELRLRHNENNITITIANNNYIKDAEPYTYEHRLEGYDKQWNVTRNNTLTYTNLPPGNYQLTVRRGKAASTPGQETIRLSIIVNHPWWSTWWAYLIYYSIAIATICTIVVNARTKIKLRSALALEKMEKEKEEELVQAKIQFFANISHEFRTPLTMIISQIDMLLQSEKLTPYLRQNLKRIQRTSYQFKELISELLDFRKIERGKMHLKVRQIDLIDFVKQVYQDFQSYAQQKGITLTFLHEAETLPCRCDSKQIQKVLTNLLTNAFKHTPADGKVDIQIVEKDTKIEIKVIDSGEGIPKEMLPFIFDRFYQAGNKASTTGSGIGLHLCKGIMELHHGSISVQSAPQYGSIFTATLLKGNPFADDQDVETDTGNAPVFISRADELPAEHAEEGVSEDMNDGENIHTQPQHGSILVVEDNEDLLDILTSLLSPIYKVSIAMNGKEGLKKAEEEQPDLILSDVMMPEMTGTEMCAKIRQDFDLCHIPVILLTALTSEEHKIEGLQCGADDYIEKPFNNKVLLGRIDNILKNRELLKKRLMSASDVKESASDIDVKTKAEIKEIENKGLVLCATDLKFIQKLEQLVEERLADPELNVDMIAGEMAVSRSTLYNKLKALGSATPNQYIMNCRLNHAARLMQTYPDMSVTDVAIQSGFNTVRYFRYCYKVRFGVSPKQDTSK